jgi:hypothetical protein
LLGHVPDPRKRPGTIKAIVEHTGLDRHQVANLLKNEVKYIPLQALSRLCDFLIERGYVPADELPGALFAVEPEHFWELLARRQRLELCVGVRREEEEEGPEGAWVVASDSVLLGELLNGVSTLGGTAKHRRDQSPLESFPIERPHPELLKQSLVWSPGQNTAEEVMRRAAEVFEEFCSLPTDKSLISLGSIKSNPVTEMILAGAFGASAFKSQDDFQRSADRSCPFFLRYRDDDPHADSCCGGVRLADDTRSKQPGFYFETPSGKWKHIAWRAADRDAALVFYIHRESQGRLEMALSGFSGRATRLLAKTLASRADDFWPPVYEGQGIQVGAFLVQYTINQRDDSHDDILQTELTAAEKVHPLDGEVIRRRLERGG